MTLEIGLVLAILVAAIVLFVTGWVRPDVTAILVLVSLVVTGLLSAEEALSGFGSEALIAIVGLLIMSAGLVRSGVVRWIAEQMERLVGDSRRRLTFLSSLLPGIVSGLVSDIATVSLFVPVVMRLARRHGTPHTRLLLPIAMAGLAGGNLTIIGASQNLLVSSLLQEAGHPPFGFFDLAPVGLALVLTFSLYALVLGQRLLPEGTTEPPPNATDTAREMIAAYDLRDRLWEIGVTGSADNDGGERVLRGIGRRYGLSVLLVVRGDEAYTPQESEVEIHPGDTLLVGGRRERVEAFTAYEGHLEVLGHPLAGEEFPSSGAELVEVVVPPRSPVRGKTLAALRMRESHGLTGVALWRSGRPVRTDVEYTPLEEGDAILLYGARESARSYDPEPALLWLHRPHPVESPRALRHLGPWAALILLAVVAGAALGWLSIAVAALGGSVAMVLLGVLTPRQAYDSVEWRMVALVGGLYPLGLALERSGAAALLSGLLAESLGALGPLAVLLGIATVALLLTQMLHGAAVAVIMAPVAVDAAELLAVTPHAMAAAVIVGASATYLLPVGHPAPLLVQRPGGYRPTDYLTYGAGLAVLTIAILAILPPLLWPF